MKTRLGLLIMFLTLMATQAMGQLEEIEHGEEASTSPRPDSLLPIRPTNSDEPDQPEASCSSAKSCGRCVSGDFGSCGWCGEHGDVGRCYECVMVGGKCIGSKEECSRPWNVRVCPENKHGHTGRHVILSVWAIVGICVGAAAACALVCCTVGCWIFFRRRRNHERQEYGYILV